MPTIKLKGYSRLALTILFTVGLITVSIIGVLKPSDGFFTVFTALAVIETIMVKSLFANGEENTTPPPT